MKRGTWAQSLRCGEIVRVAELESLGMPRSTIAARCKPGGQWRRVLPGVIALGNGGLDRRQRARAALVYGGPTAIVTGHAALAELGLRAEPHEVQLLVPHERQLSSAGFVVVERTRRMPDPLTPSGIRCAPIDRAVLDAARRATTLDAARGIVAEAIQRRRTSVGYLEAELAAGSQRGSALVRQVLAEVSDNVHSVSEADARILWRRSGIRDSMLFNVDLFDEYGTFLGSPDGWVDSVALAWEIDSYAWHLSPAQYDASEAKRTRMQSRQIIVMSSRPRLLRAVPDAVIHDLQAHYRLAQARPRPPVHALMRRAAPIR